MTPSNLKKIGFCGLLLLLVTSADAREIRQMTAKKMMPVVTWLPPEPITVGVPLGPNQLNAQANVSGTFLYTPPAGTVLPVGPDQKLAVNFKPTNSLLFSDVKKEVRINVNKKDDPKITWNNPADITYGVALSSTQLNATADVPGTFIYTPTAGTVLNAGADQVLTVDFTPDDGETYNSVNGTQVLITVNKATPVITWPNPASIAYGTALSAAELNASSVVPGTFTYTPPLGTVLNTGANQTLSVDFSPTDAVNYNSVNGVTTLITVNKATPVVTWPPPLPIKVGTPLSSEQLNATADVAGTFEYSPRAGTILPAGTNQTLSVNFTPTDAANYNVVNNTQVLITVNEKDNPVVTWANPADITYGTALGGAQLNATANVPGTFVYLPVAGTVLNVGASQVLTATFTPTDGTNYNSVITTVAINVNKATLTATASSTSRAYGAPNPAFSIVYSGFVNGDTPAVIDTAPTVTCAAIVGSPAGTAFPIVPAGGADNNYNFNYVNGSLSITKASLAATADNKSRPYGSANPAFTISYSGFVNGDDPSDITPPTASSPAAAASSAGTYPISLSGGVSSNYNFVFQGGVLTIGKALLTVTADNQSRTYGQANPPLTISYSGFVNGETATQIGSPPIASTTAALLSNVGNYAITVAGGSATNYDFSFVSGTLSVTKSMLTATANNHGRLLATPNPPLTISYSGFVNSETIAVIDTPPVASTTATTSSPLGNYVITVSSGSDNNYDFTYVPGTLAIVSTFAPVITDFSIVTDEDVKFAFDYKIFNQNFIDISGDSIVSIKIVQPPTSGDLLWLGKKVVAGDEILVTHGELNDFKYSPAANYNGRDAITWNVFDGNFTSTKDAVISIYVIPVNDPPVLSDVESEPILYSLGDPAVVVSKTILVNDIDNAFISGASITVAENYKTGDLLALEGAANPNITATFDPVKGELVLEGNDSKSNYETALHHILFSSPISAETTLSVKKVTISVTDSIDDSNLSARTIQITNVFPELSIVNAFTPNRDGVNDYWDFVGLQFYTQINIGVFDENGMQVFECMDKNCKWDGKVNGKELPAGPYFYTIDLGSGKRRYRGTVTILK